MKYRIEFNGGLLDGFDPKYVRRDVGLRLRLRHNQIERLFSGQTVVLKKEISEENSQTYLRELQQLGMNAVLVPLEPISETATKGETRYKVVFWGRILPGFERDKVLTAAAERMSLNENVIERAFSGSKSVL